MRKYAQILARCAIAVACLVAVLWSGDVCFAAGKALITPNPFETGAIAEGAVYNYTLTVENAGDGDLIVSAPYTTCGCTKVVSPKERSVIKPGEKLPITFTFDSSGYSGEVTNSIYFNTSDPAQSTVAVPVKAVVVAKKEAFIERFKNFGLATIVTASLLDSINPCAFTVIVFFVSFLAFAGYDKKTMIAVGLAFIVAVFVSYILIGLGLFQFLKQVAVFHTMAKIVYLVTAFLALALGAYSFYDAWVFHKTKNTEKILLKLPEFLKSRIQSVIRKKTDIRPGRAEHGKHLAALMASALSCGFIVSALEFVCTGQLYLPTIVYILGVPELRLKAIAYLLLYNFIFIFPLFVILYLGVLGVTSVQFSNILRRHLSIVKIATALFFVALGAALLIFVRK